MSALLNRTSPLPPRRQCNVLPTRYTHARTQYRSVARPFALSTVPLFANRPPDDLAGNQTRGSHGVHSRTKDSHPWRRSTTSSHAERRSLIFSSNERFETSDCSLPIRKRRLLQPGGDGTTVVSNQEEVLCVKADPEQINHKQLS